MSELLKINVNEHCEKKGNLTYLSWAWAWAEVLKIDPQATWVAHEFGPEGCLLPFMSLPDSTAMVKVGVTIAGHYKCCLLPVMDHRNKAITCPDAFQVNTAIMRCLAKAISMHGLGLYIYAGEDLPEGEEREEEKPKMIHRPVADAHVDPKRMSLLADCADAIKERMTADDVSGAYEIASGVTDSEEKMQLWSLLDSKTRSAIKKFSQQLKEETI